MSSVNTHRLPQTGRQDQLYPLVSVRSTKAGTTVTYSWNNSDRHDFLSKLRWHVLAFMEVASIQAPCVYNSYPSLRFHMSRWSHVEVRIRRILPSSCFLHFLKSLRRNWWQYQTNAHSGFPWMQTPNAVVVWTLAIHGSHLEDLKNAQTSENNGTWINTQDILTQLIKGKAWTSVGFKSTNIFNVQQPS